MLTSNCKMAMMAKLEDVMKTVNVAKLKNQLSAYLAYVRKGEQVLIKDRNKPIAKIVPLDVSEDEDAELLALASEGAMKMAEIPGGTPESFYSLPATRLSHARAVEAVRKERDEGD
jgi:prevent-host-death family protein